MLLFDDQDYYIHHGDTIPHMIEDMPSKSIDLAVTSPPFVSLYSYTSLPEDLGNSEGFLTEAKLHFSYFCRALIWVMKPGRVVVMHCMQVPRMKRAGGEGLFDFRGFLIRLAERAGLIFEYDWLISKNPQAQALRTHSHELQFAGLERDRAQSRGALGDYLLKFRAPGTNAVPIRSTGQVSRTEWIDWAECCWDDIKATDTLNVQAGRGEEDVRHICPLQLGVIDRLVHLYSNPGEIIFDPFSGIGSTGFIALKYGRRYYGTEIKDEYYDASIANLDRAIAIRRESSRTLFDMIEEKEEETTHAIH